MSDKSPRQSSTKKSDKSIKEKRAIKKAKKGGGESPALFPASGRAARTPGSGGL
jgi:hypothetical protein